MNRDYGPALCKSVGKFKRNESAQTMTEECKRPDQVAEQSLLQGLNQGF